MPTSSRRPHPLALVAPLLLSLEVLAERPRPPAPVRDLLAELPPSLLREGPQGLLWWQWLAMPLVLALAWVLGRLLSGVTRSIFLRLASKSRATWDDQLVQNLSRPLTVAWGIALFAAFSHFLWLSEAGANFIDRALAAAIFVVFFWALLRAIDTVHGAVVDSPWALARPGSRALFPLMSRVAKVVVLCIAVVATLSELGYPVASLIAGLGIGGLAFALAAQKTVENLFGAFSLGVDQPFREGDFVRVEDFVGTVETIGLRSTRFRTLDRTLVSLPNGKLAEMRVENFAPRDRFRLYTVLNLTYGTTQAQMRAVLEGIEKVLRGHEKIWPDAVVVRFMQFGASSLDVEVVAWFVTGDWAGFQLARQEVLLQIMEVVERAGSSFAFPTRTVHLVREEGPASTSAA